MNRIINFLNIKKYSSDKRKQFIFNVFLGIVVLFFLTITKDTAIRQSFINGWFDYYIMFRMDSETDTINVAHDIVFLDFDNKSFQTLNRADMTPRDKVAALLKMAYLGNAKVIVLDFDFSEPDYRPAQIFANEEISLSGLDRDQILFETIQQIKNDSSATTKILVPLVTYADKTVKHNIFESLIDSKTVFAVTPTLTTNQIGDNYTRFWLPYLEVKDNKTGDRDILWSIPLLTSVLYAGDFDELENLKTKILTGNEDSFSVNINYKQKKEFTFYRETLKNGGLLRDTTALQYNRIQYSLIPADVLTQFPFGTVQPANIGHWRKGGLDNQRIDFSDKIVIIGRSDGDCADFYSTPCGILPGLYIHGNAIFSILGKTRPHLTPLYKHLLIELYLIVFVAYLFLGLSEFKATGIVCVLTVLCVILSYVYFCYTNEFVYFVFAFTSEGMYNFANNIQRMLNDGLITIELSFRRFRGRR